MSRAAYLGCGFLLFPLGLMLVALARPEYTSKRTYREKRR
jgi:hypothetical protein